MTTDEKEGLRLWQTVAIEGGRRYELSAWLKSDIRAGGRAFLTIEYYRDTINAAGYKGSTDSVNFGSFEQWERVAVDAEAPADANRARIYLRMTGPGNVYYDDAVFRLISGD